MKLLLPVLLAAVLTSCSSSIRRTVVPLTDPRGVPVAVKIQGVPPGTEPKLSQIMALAEGLVENVDANTVKEKYIPGFDAGNGDVFALVVEGPYGSLTTKRGERFVGYAPFLKIGLNRPAAEVNQIAKRISADVYRHAKRKYSVYSQSELRKVPQLTSASSRQP